MPEKPLPDPQRFPAVMERTIQLVGQNVPRDTLQEVAKVFHTLCWEFRDYGVKTYFLVSDAGEVDSAQEWSGAVDSVITMDARTFHDAAFGKANFGTAFLMGKLQVKGIPALKLGKFTPLLKPFLDSYQQACEESHGTAT